MNVIDDLKAKAREWAAKVVLLANTPVPKEMVEEKNRLLKYAKTVKNSIESVFPAFDEIAPFDNAVGLGIAPIVAGAGIAAAVAAIAYWTYDYNKFQTKLSEYNKLINAGHRAENAASIINTITDKKGLFNFSAGNFLPLVLFGGIGYLIWSKK